MNINNQLNFHYTVTVLYTKKEIYQNTKSCIIHELYNISWQHYSYKFYFYKSAKNK